MINLKIQKMAFFILHITRITLQANDKQNIFYTIYINFFIIDFNGLQLTKFKYKKLL